MRWPSVATGWTACRVNSVLRHDFYVTIVGVQCGTEVCRDRAFSIAIGACSVGL